MSKRDEILEKIRKLQAHADSAAEIGNEAEAQAFAAKVQELLTAYKLSAADIGDGPRTNEPVATENINWSDLGMEDKTSRVFWAEQLAGLIARAYYCEFVIVGYGGRIGFIIGTVTARQLAKYMFITIGRALYRISATENKVYKLALWREAGCPRPYKEPEEARNFKNGFKLGFINRLRERFDEELKPKTDLAQTQAIVLVRKDALAKVRSWMDDNLSLKKASRLRVRGNEEGAARGRAAANALNLKPNPVGVGVGGPKELR